MRLKKIHSSFPHLQKNNNRATVTACPKFKIRPGCEYHLHISVVDESPSPGSFQRIVQEILEFPIAGMFFRRSGSTGGDAGPRFAEDAAPLGAFRTRNEQCPVPAGFGSARVQSHKPDFELLLSGLSWVNPTVERFLHHSKVETTRTRSCPCPCRGDASPALRGVCCW